MSTLIFQITLKQWDKSQRSEQHTVERKAYPTEHTILGNASFMVLDMPCILDQHAIDFTESDSVITGADAGRSIEKSLLKDGSIKIDRFKLFKDQDNEHTLHIQYMGPDNQVTSVGSLDTLQAGDWCQASYQWRYRVEANNQIFWQYEHVTINMACLDSVNPTHFVNRPASIIFVAPEE